MGEFNSKTESPCKNHPVSTSAVKPYIPHTPQSPLAAPPPETSTEVSRSTSGTHNDGTLQNSQFDASRDGQCDCQSTPSSNEDSSTRNAITSSDMIDAHITLKQFTSSKRDNLLHDITKFDLTRLKHVDKPEQVQELPNNITTDWYVYPRPSQYTGDDSSDDDDDDDNDDDEWDD